VPSNGVTHPARWRDGGSCPVSPPGKLTQERTDMREKKKQPPRISRSLSSGAHSRDPLARPGYAC